jgi:hypothetical protein
MANTTNFGWETPDDTDLVKDGAAAIRTLGSSIDTSFVDLKGGTTGQVLAKASNTDLDFTWSAADPLSILDAKADLITATAADTPARLAVGADGTYLQADSSTATGLKWGTVSSGSMTLISTANPSGANTISFTSIPTTYKQLYLVWNLYHNSSSEYLYIRLNNNSGGDYYSKGITVTNNTLSYATASGSTGFGDSDTLAPVDDSNSSLAGHRYQGYMTIEQANEAVTHNINYTTFGRSNAGGLFGNITTGVYAPATPAAITRLDFIRSSTQTITGTVLLYGVN